MIPGHTEKKINQFRTIDRCKNSYGWVTPLSGEEFFGIPWGWYHENQQPFIEIREKGVVKRTVNLMDCAVIEFDYVPQDD